MLLETVDTPVRDYITMLETHNHELQARYEHQIHKTNKLKTELLEYKHKYLEIEEKYTLLIYKRFMRSAEQLPEIGRASCRERV